MKTGQEKEKRRQKSCQNKVEDREGGRGPENPKVVGEVALVSDQTASASAQDADMNRDTNGGTPAMSKNVQNAEVP